MANSFALFVFYSLISYLKVLGSLLDNSIQLCSFAELAMPSQASPQDTCVFNNYMLSFLDLPAQGTIFLI